MKISKGFSAIEGLLILVIVGILGFTGWFVWHSKQNTDNTNQSTSQASSSQTNNTSSNLTKYDNKELAFTFSYPKEWGTVVADKPTNSDKLLFAGKFDKMTDVTFGVASKDYTAPEYLGDPPCFENGFGSFAYIDLTNDQYSSSKELLKTSDRQVVRSYHNGYCAGATLDSVVKLDLKSSNGIEVTYFKQIPYTSQAIADLEKANAIPSSVSDSFVRVTKSVSKE